MWSRGVRVLSAFRSRRGAFGKPQAIAGGDLPSLAVDRRGNALVAWAVELRRDRGARVQAALRPAGRHFGKPRTIARGEGVGSLQTAFGPAGEALAVWEELELDGSLFPTGSRIRAAAFRR